MVSIPLGLGDWESSSQDIPRLKMNNMYVTGNPSSPDEVSRVSRPALEFFKTVGTGPIKGFWRQYTTLNGDWLVVSGTELYRVNDTTYVATKLGDVPGSGNCEFAGTPTLVVFVRDGIVYLIDGGVLSTITTPDDDLIESVATINSYFLLTVKDQQKFFWMDPGEITIDALNFASAERIPDPIQSVKVISDEVWFLGKSGPEVWTPTGDADAPFQRVSGRVYNEGCFARSTAVSTTIDGIPSLLWVTDTKAVVFSQGAPKKISNESVEELLKTTDDLVGWTFRHSRHDFYVLTSPLFSLVYDINTGFWMKWGSYLKEYWRAELVVQISSDIYVGDREDGTIWKLVEGVSDGADPIIREVSGFLPNSGPAIRCGVVEAFVNSGWSPSYDLNPSLELRWSEDLGATWSDYITASLGERGNFTRTVTFRSLGLIRNPGRVFEFRISDPVRFRLDYATVNERN